MTKQKQVKGLKHLPPNVQLFLDHLAVGLDCFDLDFYSYKPLEVNHDTYGTGVTFSQLYSAHKTSAKHNVVISNGALHLSGGGTLPFSNEQPPLKVMLLLLSAMVTQVPLEIEPCPKCSEDA